MGEEGANFPPPLSFNPQKIMPVTGKGLPRTRIRAGQSSDPANIAKVPSYTVATAPAASANTNCLIRVTNGSAGANCLAFSDGTNWKVVALGSNIAAA